jgi:N-ethylmaleimide reductase
MHEKLLSPAKLGPWELANRVVMPPLTRSRAEADWSPSRYAPEYYRQRNTAGLVICEATQVSPDATGYVRTPGIWTEAHVAVWRQIVDGIHAGGAKAVLQLWHCGRIAHPDNQPPGCYPMGPSAVQPGLPIYTDVAGGVVENPVPREMTEADIQGVIDAYAKACANAKAAGFDGVELHAANGYLVEQFAATNTNLRTDKWGGSVENRMRFMTQVLAAMATVYPANCIGVRLSPYGTFNDIQDADPKATYEAMLGVAQTSGVGYVHIIRPVVSGNIEMEASARDREVIDTARRHYTGTLIGAAGYTPDSAEAALQQGAVDLVAFGRAYVGNPDLVARIRRGVAFAENDQSTLYTAGANGYTDYPTAT